MHERTYYLVGFGLLLGLPLFWLIDQLPLPDAVASVVVLGVAFREGWRWYTRRPGRDEEVQG